MRNMSFMLTKEQVRNKTKFVTRRNGWWFLKPGEIVHAVEKCQGLKKGEKMVKMCLIRILNTKPERLDQIDEPELILEGFPEMKPHEFVTMFCKSHRNIEPNSIINRIEFEYV